MLVSSFLFFPNSRRSDGQMIFENRKKFSMTALVKESLYFWIPIASFVSYLISSKHGVDADTTAVLICFVIDSVVCTYFQMFLEPRKRCLFSVITSLTLATLLLYIRREQFYSHSDTDWHAINLYVAVIWIVATTAFVFYWNFVTVIRYWHSNSRSYKCL
jgi:hypothetical protein